jgi:hypothetical protein
MKTVLSIWWVLGLPLVLCSYVKFQPYPGYDPSVPQKYIFAPFGSLDISYILREDASSVDRKPNDGETRGGKDGEHKCGEDGREGGKGQDGKHDGVERTHDKVYGVGQDEHKQVSENTAQSQTVSNDNNGDEGEDELVWDSDDADFVVYSYPFSKFPFLRHHAHPFYVIVNAIPKLQAKMLPGTFEGPLAPGLLKTLQVMQEILWKWNLWSRLEREKIMLEHRKELGGQSHEDGDSRAKGKQRRQEDTPTDQSNRKTGETDGDADGVRVVGKRKRI